MPMFENREEELESLLDENVEFRRLYRHHQGLDKRIAAAESGTAPMENLALSELKREKLRAKDRLTWMLQKIQAA